MSAMPARPRLGPALAAIVFVLAQATAAALPAQTRDPAEPQATDPKKQEPADPTPRREPGGRGGSGGLTAERLPAGGTASERFSPPALANGLTWTRWWFHNKDRFLELHRRFVLSAWVSGPGETVDHAAAERERTSRRPGFLRYREEKLLPVLLAAARDSDRRLRISALFALGNLGDSAAVQPVIEMVKDPDRTVREMAVLSLGMLGDARAQPVLAAVLNGGEDGRQVVGTSRIPQRLRGLAALALGLLTVDQQVEHLLCMAVRRRKLPDDIRMGAVAALGFVGGDRAVDELGTVAVSGRESAAMRSLAVEALARTGHTSALPFIARALDARHPDVQAAAVLAAATFRYPTEEGDRFRRASEVFRQRREAGALSAEETRQRGLELNREAERIDRLESPRFQRRAQFRARLRRRVDKYRGPRDRGLAAVALGEIGELRDAELLGRLLDKGDAETRGLAALGLGILARRLDHEGRLAPRLAQAFSAARGNARLQSAFALALGLTGDRRGGSFLRGELDRIDNREVRAFVVQGLGLLADRKALERARAAVLDTRDAWELQYTVQGYALLADPPAGTPLLASLSASRSDAERRAIATAAAFAAVGLEQALDPLLGYLGSHRTPLLHRALVTEALGLAARIDGPLPLARVAAGHNFSVAAPVVDLAIRLRW